MNGKIMLRVLIICAVYLFGSLSVFSKAEAPTLAINGYTLVSVKSVNQKDSQNGKGGTDPHIGIGVSDLYFTITGKAANGMEYKYRINFETIPGSSMYVNKNYVEFSGNFGVVQAGNLKGPEDTMPFSGTKLAGGAAGIDGGLDNVYNFSSGVIGGVNFIGETGKSTKLVFYSPEALGFQLGVALTPNTSHMGKSGRNNARSAGNADIGNQTAIYPDKVNAPFGRHNVVVGITYKRNVGKWSYKLAAVGVAEKTRFVPRSYGQGRVSVHNARSYQLSACMGYDKWKVAAGWIDNGKSRLPHTAVDINRATAANRTYLGDTYKGDAGRAWNIGAKYVLGAYEFAAIYHRTDRKTDDKNKATSDVITASIDFNALQGLKFFGEVDFIRTRTNAGAKEIQQRYMSDIDAKGNKAIDNNQGAVLVLGTKMNF
ncbi:MAG: porin [Alphaproteobacteria bacterium]